jgi:hypothetical protein
MEKSTLPIGDQQWITDKNNLVNRSTLPDARSVHFYLDRTIAKLAWRIKHNKPSLGAEEYLHLARHHYARWQRTLDPRELRRGLDICQRGLE